MMKLFKERGYEFSTTEKKDIARNIKEKLSYISFDFEADMQKTAFSSKIVKSYELTDGNVITIGSERSRCPEMLLKSHFDGMEYDELIKHCLCPL
jgi:actin